MIWRCPACKGELLDGGSELRCRGCARRFACLGDIPDLRLAGASWIDPAEDRRQAEELLRAGGMSAEALLRGVYGGRAGWDASLVELRVRQVLAAPTRFRDELEGWLRPLFARDGPVLDLGCGAGTLLAAAHDRAVIGVDVSMTWLVVARRLIEEAGGRPVLAAGLAEALPLSERSVTGTVALDLIEHVADPVACLREIDRVTRPGGYVALATPNRFSLAAEPHVFVWGVGWLPRRWQTAYVRWRARKTYAYTHLLSTMEMKRLLKRHTAFTARILIPPVPRVELERFPPHRARLARLYNRLIGVGWLRPLFLVIAPFFRVMASKDRERPARSAPAAR